MFSKDKTICDSFIVLDEKILSSKLHGHVVSTVPVYPPTILNPNMSYIFYFLHRLGFPRKGYFKGQAGDPLYSKICIISL